MTRYLLAMIAAAGIASGEAAALERNYTIRGSGYVEGGGRAGRMDLSEVRMTLHDNGDFAATLFARGERVIVRGNWNRRGNGNVERLLIESVRGVRAEGSGTIQYRRDGDSSPERLVIEGRTRNGTFHAVIDETRRQSGGSDPGGWDREGWDPDGRTRPGSSNRLRYDIDATTYGDGMVRMSGVRGGDFSTVRARLGTNRDVRIDIDRSTRGTIRGQIQDVRGDRISVRVTDMFGYTASGDLVVVLRGSNDVARINGSGTSRNGSWQFDFDGNARREDDPWGNGGSGRVDDRTERGSGQLRQDLGPAIPFDRMRVSLQNDREAVVVLDGRRDPVRFVGRWSTGWDGDVVIQLQRVNEMRASGRLELRRSGSRVTSLTGNGRTERGRFEVWFSR